MLYEKAVREVAFLGTGLVGEVEVDVLRGRRESERVCTSGKRTGINHAWARESAKNIE